ncbi:MAG: acyltransferase family protein [Lachnospiraceae bacterium]|nr:acyltransferase family protein [Lachnospiraceae bacterium]
MAYKSGDLKDTRDYFIDNLKAFLIVLVIWGHVESNLRPVGELTRLYYFIHTFHMPCFAFTSGYLAKSVVKDGKFRAERYFSTLWLFVFFRLMNCGIAHAFGRQTKLEFFDISSAAWYLLALSAWYVLVPLLLSMKPRTGLAVTTLSGLLVGYADNVSTFLTFSRMVVFLPFFAAGLYLSKEGLAGFLSKYEKLRIPAAVFLLLAAGGFVFLGNPLGSCARIVFGGMPYSVALKTYAPYGFFIRGGLYLFAVLVSAACMLLVPRRKLWFSYVGKYSLAIYILHILVRDALLYAGVFGKIKKLPGIYMLLSIPACVAAALVLGNPVFGKAMNWVADPVKQWRQREKKKALKA